MTIANQKKREALVEAKEEILQARKEYEREEKERRGDLLKQERRPSWSMRYCLASSLVKPEIRSRTSIWDFRRISTSLRPSRAPRAKSVKHWWRPRRKFFRPARSIHPGHGLQSADVPALPADDASLHLVVGQGYHRDGGLRHMIEEENLDRKTENIERKEDALQNRLNDVEKARNEVEILRKSQMVHLPLGLLHHFLNAGGVDAPVLNELLQGNPGNFPADRVEAGDGDGLRRVVDNQIQLWTECTQSLH